MKEHLLYVPNNQEELLLDKLWERFNKYSGEDIKLSEEQHDEMIKHIQEYGTNQYVDGLSK